MVVGSSRTVGEETVITAAAASLCATVDTGVQRIATAFAEAAPSFIDVVEASSVKLSRSVVALIRPLWRITPSFLCVRCCPTSGESSA